MKTNTPLPDDAIESMLLRRMTRARPIGLEESIMNDVTTTDQRRRSWLGLGLPGRSSGLAFAGILIAAGMLTALIVGGSLSGGGRATDQPNPALTTSNAAAPSAGIRILGCDPRPLAYTSGVVDLTGSWDAAGSLIYLTQRGSTLWGVAIFSVEGPYLDPAITDVGPYLVLHGAVGSDGRAQMDWASTGLRFPGELRFDHFQDAAGSIVFERRQGTDGNLQLVAASETGTDWSGNAFSALVLSPCTPSLH
jgi:hypothetical protein